VLDSFRIDTVNRKNNATLEQQSLASRFVNLTVLEGDVLFNPVRWHQVTTQPRTIACAYECVQHAPFVSS
jgi:hypothetical protein